MWKRKTNGNYAEDDENEHSDGSPTLKKNKHGHWKTKR